MSMVSIWRGGAAQTWLPELEGRVSADVAIVGGGITGLTLAMLMSEEGKSVVLLEAHAIASGSSGNSTGNLYEVLSDHLYPIGEKWSRSVMGVVADSRREAVALIEHTAARLGGCGFQRCALNLYATTASQVEVVEKEYQAAKRLGLSAHLVDQPPIPVNGLRTLILENQAQFHPLAYLRALAQHIASDRCRLYENSAVLAIEKGALHTEHGSVNAPDIVLATHTPTGVYMVQAQMVPHREYGIGVRLRSGPYPEGIFWGLGDDRHSIRSLRTDGTDYLILVGEEHRTGQQVGQAPLERLESFARQHFDVAAVDYRWSAQNYRPVDGLPYIGRSHASDVYIATGYGEDGLTYGTLAARIIADQILGHENRWADTYRAARLAPLKGAKEMLDENLNVAKALVQDHLTRPDTALASIAPGSGAVIEVRRERVAAYRDEAGAVWALSPVCPHMKCIVRWNDAEKSWDCPCHGSRFDGITGEVIEGPALAALKRRHIAE